MKKKSLHISHTDVGSDSRILKEMKALACSNYQVSALGIKTDEGAALTNIDFEADISSINLKSRNIKILPRTLRHIASLVEMIFKMLPIAIEAKPDVIHCHDTLALPIGVLAKFFTKSKIIYDAHELESDRNGLSKLQGVLTRAVEKLLWPFIDGLIIVSPSIQKWYMNNLGLKKSCVILNSPIFNATDKNSGDYLRTFYSIPTDAKIYIYVGILSDGRGIDIIEKVFMMPGVKSHVVFLGYGPLRDGLKDVEKNYRNIHVHDAVPHSEVVSIVKSANFGLCLIQNVSLSDFYCLPNKLFEYCFAGIPILASNFPDISSVIEDYCLGESCELTVDAVADAVNRLDSRGGINKFKDLKPLSWQAQEVKLLNFYKNLC